jgi:Subtilase family
LKELPVLRRQMATGMAALVVLAASAQAAAAAGPPQSLPPVMLTGGTSAVSGHKALGSRLSSRLEALSRPAVRSASATQQARVLGLPATGPASLAQSRGAVVVDVRATNTSAGFVQALRNAGGRVLYVSARYHIVTVSVAPANLERLAAVPDVLNVRPELRPVTSAFSCPSGVVTSEADGELRAATARATFGVSGAGVKVGVISDSYDHRAVAATHAAQDIAGGDLPGVGNPCGLTSPVEVLAEGTSAGDEDEGRAMMQVVHDLAPSAKLAFAAADPETAFPARVQSLWQTDGARVIVDDISYFDEPYFQDGPQAVAANNAVAHNAAYFSSAANNNFIQGGVDRASWEAPSYRNTTCPTLPDREVGCMNFGTAVSPANAQPFTLAPGGVLLLDLQWAEPWFGVNHDYDAFLLDNTAAHNVVAVGDDENAGPTGTQQPVEILGFKNPSSTAQTFFLVLGNFLGTAGPRVKWTLAQPSGNGVDAVVSSVTPGDLTGPAIFGHNGASSAMSVAAVPFSAATQVEDFSSRGPVTHYFGPVTSIHPAAPTLPRAFAKPDVAAIDGAATTFFAQQDGSGTWRFFGTSEAAPHAAAVAALEMQANPRITAAQIMNAERTTATGLTGFGTTARGSGLVDAVAAVGAAKVAIPPKPAPPPTPKPTAKPKPFTASGRIAARQHLSGKAVVFRVTCSQACNGQANGRVKVKGRRGTLRLKAVHVSVRAGHTKRVKLRLSKSVIAKVRRALRHHKRVTVTVVVRLKAGTAVETLGKTIRLVR